MCGQGNNPTERLVVFVLRHEKIGLTENIPKTWRKYLSRESADKEPISKSSCNTNPSASKHIDKHIYLMRLLYNGNSNVEIAVMGISLGLMDPKWYLNQPLRLFIFSIAGWRESTYWSL
ncbi:hypothetical protein TNCT_141851 [Trichonephila clavata]|uniref:Uncharacterized protein n=1 Tax=Trichonephila clavata TaxID=2740835 RepID=A0A8X6F6B2_TRICU|nr:hypothetical protein TNCT_141851 [Trichonephila clavata]